MDCKQWSRWVWCHVRIRRDHSSMCESPTEVENLSSARSHAALFHQKHTLTISQRPHTLRSLCGQRRRTHLMEAFTFSRRHQVPRVQGGGPSWTLKPSVHKKLFDLCINGPIESCHLQCIHASATRTGQSEQTWRTALPGMSANQNELSSSCHCFFFWFVLN